MDSKLKVSQSKFANYFRRLSVLQILSVVSLITLSLALPLSIFLSLAPINPRIVPATGPVTPPSTNTPTPSDNINILTDKLPEGRFGKNYQARIEGYSKDQNAKLLFNATNLPLDLKLQNCVQNQRNLQGKGKVSYLSCNISGRVNETGDYQVMLILSDQNNITVRYLKLTIAE